MALATVEIFQRPESLRALVAFHAAIVEVRPEARVQAPGHDARIGDHLVERADDHRVSCRPNAPVEVDIAPDHHPGGKALVDNKQRAERIERMPDQHSTGQTQLGSAQYLTWH